ncbi:MAG: 7-cyano-7-deazaguanine synthase, partial [Candidatus Margulisiibacteriota bacterium]
QKMIEQGTKARGIKVITPLINMTKAQIVKLGHKLGAPLEDTWSCYVGDKEPCGVCDSCRLRHKGFSLYNRGK